MADATRDDPDGTAADDDWSRRRLLRFAGAGAAAASLGRVVYELLGFGVLTGTNLTAQDPERVVGSGPDPSPFELALADGRLAFDGESVERVVDGDRVAVVPLDDVDGAAAPGDGAAGVAADLAAVESGAYAVEFLHPDALFDRVEAATARPGAVAALRGDRFRDPSPETVRRFAGVDPAEPAALVDGLAEGFRSHTHFDTTRYVAESVEDHLLLGTVPLRGALRESTAFDAILDGSTGLYCYEYARRAMEAFHVVAPHRQTTPVFGATVHDPRHNHVFSGLGSVVRADGGLRVLLTFLDYSHATLYDTFGLRPVLGDGVDAYDSRHRATRIRY